MYQESWMGSVWGLTLVLVWGPRWDAGVDGWPRLCEFLKKLKVPEVAEGEDEMVSTGVSQGRIDWVNWLEKHFPAITEERTSHIRPTGGSPWRVRAVDVKRDWHRWISTYQGIRVQWSHMLTYWKFQTNNSLCQKWRQRRLFSERETLFPPCICACWATFIGVNVLPTWNPVSRSCNTSMVCNLDYLFSWECIGSLSWLFVGQRIYFISVWCRQKVNYSVSAVGCSQPTQHLNMRTPGV